MRIREDCAGSVRDAGGLSEERICRVFSGGGIVRIIFRCIMRKILKSASEDGYDGDSLSGEGRRKRLFDKGAADFVFVYLNELVPRILFYLPKKEESIHHD